MATPAPKFLKRQQDLDTLFADFDCSDAPGLVVAIRSDAGLSYRRGFGLANVQSGLANTPLTRFRFASITKQFTCLAIMLLAEDGLVDIGAPISTYLDGLAEPVGQATLGQLMSHTSGIRCTLELGTVANGFAPQPRSWQAEAIRRQQTLQYAPGTEQLYCNGTFVMISDLIEQAAGMTFPAFARQRIFEPLGMFDTEIVEDDHMMVPGLASPHVRAGDHWKRPPVDTELRGDGGIVSTVDDMVRWLKHVRNPKGVGSDGTWQQMLAPVTLERGFVSTYAMGIKRHRYRGVEVLQHSGGLFGLNAQILTVPDHALDIAVAINGAPASATRTAFAALDICLEPQLSAPGFRRPESAQFTYLLGQHFAHPSGLLVSFDEIEGTLAMAQMNMAPAPILYEDESSIFALFEEIGFGPLVWRKTDLAKLANGHRSLLPVTIAGKECVLEQLRLPEDSPAQSYRRAVGTYFSEPLAAQLDVSPDGDEMTVRLSGDYSGRRRFSVSPLSNRHVGIVSEDGGERYSIEFDEGADGTVTGLWIDSHRARRVRFERSAGGHS